MQFKPTATLALTWTLLNPALATTIWFGKDGQGDTVTWYTDPCQNPAPVLLNGPGANPCGIGFSFPSLSGAYILNGCGGPLWLTNYYTGGFITNCISNPTPWDCGYYEEWECTF
ncbi:hypothetical protein N431DRAFT_464213 [Stipitochalara longipes BDJ]|nr:hypothetical protein N431DRAFT_464213 [Stipitochalara longipes BDJ]